ncbi:MAG: hypothetical protein R3A12_03585 [Ignavibacteria bacterium]
MSNPLGSSYIRGVDNIGDVTDDNIDDIAIATQLSPRLLVLNGANGKILFDYSFGSTISQRGDRAAVLDDIDSNGVNEILGGNRGRQSNLLLWRKRYCISVNSEVSQINDFTLYQNYPNPFNPFYTYKI